MKLHRVDVKHYSQKDSHTSIEGFVIADNEEEVLAWVPALCWEDWESDGDEGSAGPGDEWWDKHPDEHARAEAMGLTVHLCDWGEREGQPDWVEGPKQILLRWWRGDSFDEVSDLYYGATQWDWDEGREITEDEAAVLIRLGVATDARS